jgi:hypothetical protein
MRPDQDHLVRLSFTGDGAGIAMEHLHAYMRDVIILLPEQKKRAQTPLGYEDILLYSAIFMSGASVDIMRSDGGRKS